MKKKWIFVLVFFLGISIIRKTLVYGDLWRGDDYGLASVYFINFIVNITPGKSTSVYDFYVGVSNGDNGNVSIVGVYAVDSNGNESKLGDASFFYLDGEDYCADDVVINNSYNISEFKLYFKHSGDNYSTLYNVNSTMRYKSEPTMTPEPTATSTPTPKPTATSTPIPKPTATSTPIPKPTATNTPTPKPTATSTPSPSPTNTPTPTPSPSPTPFLRLDAYLEIYEDVFWSQGIEDLYTAVAEYETGGFTPVKSIIALYEVPDAQSYIGTLVEQDVFESGAGTMRVKVGFDKYYRYKLTYTYVYDGVQRTEIIWSDVLYTEFWNTGWIVDGKIENFKDLMQFVWYELMDLDLLADGFKFSIKSYYLWLIAAGLLIIVIREILD